VGGEELQKPATGLIAGVTDQRRQVPRKGHDFYEGILSELVIHAVRELAVVLPALWHGVGVSKRTFCYANPDVEKYQL
jgi:hypothetical protein